MNVLVNKLTKVIRQSAIKAGLALIMVSAGVNAWAVTDSEMDQARAIAAKFYIRYINNGAGYLDNWLPKSMSELEKKLTNNTDRNNLKNFKKIDLPAGYETWDKAQLVKYWSESFFNNNSGALDQKAAGNALCKRQIKTAVERLAIAAPAPAPAPAEAEAAAPAPAPEQSETQAEAEDAIAAELAQTDAEIQEAQDIVDNEARQNASSESSGTWVYIMILAILVAVVIFLVVYASRTMKGQPRKKKEEDEYEAPEPEEEDTGRYAPQPPVAVHVHTPVPVVPEPRPAMADDTRIREKYAATLAAKADEIRNLTRQLSEMESLAAGLKEENRRLSAEVEQLKSYSGVHAARHGHQGNDTHYHRPHHNNQHHSNREAAPQAQEPAGEPREVYLGRVNSRGIFVRADRHAVDGQSIYKLTTTNGRTGTYTLIHNPLIEEQVLEDPGKWLAGGCFAKDIFDTDGRQSICTETPGTAVFSDGAWRVERKAKIRFC